MAKQVVATAADSSVSSSTPSSSVATPPATSPTTTPGHVASHALTLLRPLPLFLLAGLLRLGLLLYGIRHDAHSVLKYTDIDYRVFTDAARAVAHGKSPYTRATYRYTPLLAWLLVPTARHGFGCFGKLLFAAADLLAGALLRRLLLLRRRCRGDGRAASAYAALWLWNPMVAVISTRGSAEGLLCLLTVSLLWAVERRKLTLAALLLGLSVHVKIYPFIYAPAIVWCLDDKFLRRAHAKSKLANPVSLLETVISFCSPERIRLAVWSLLTFMGLNALMYYIYGKPFIDETFIYHLVRIDHRHNFSPYNVLLYYSSTLPSNGAFRIESLAFIPQLLLSCVLIPLMLAKRDLATSMLAQTFAFVTFNKVCTSQYFLWYMVFLPLYLPDSSLLRDRKLGASALLLWVATQSVWLHQAYKLEFLGISTFEGLWLSSQAFFLVNCWIMGIIISDGATLQA